MAVERTTITELLDSYVICRTLGHAWDVIPNAQFSLDLFRTSSGAMALRCIRCFTERYDYIGKDMEIAYRTYKYPEHYKGIVGEGNRPNLRSELFRRSLLVQAYARANGRRART